MIQASCSNCGVSFEADEDELGQIVRCRHCDIDCIVPSKRIQPGTMFGSYQIQYPIGVGGTSEVHLALDIRNSQRVAVKILFLDDVDDIDLKRFAKESTLAQSLNHRGLVKIHEFGASDQHCYMAMEFVEGQTLHTLLNDHGILRAAEAMKICREVALALDYAWGKKQIVHRDIKPGNILLSYDGVTKLMDLGISKSLLFDRTRLTATHTIIGTPYYMSPEQCSSGRPIDFRADIYSLGATMYHLVTGRYPHDGSSAMEIVRRQMLQKLVDPRNHVPDLPGACSYVVQKMMSKAPANRQQSWRELINDITSALAHCPE